MFEVADRLGVPHRGFRSFPAGKTGADDLLRLLDQGRGQAIESPWWVSSRNAQEGLDRWCPPRDIAERDRESWRLSERFPGGFVLEAALEGARRLKVPWRRPNGVSEFELGRIFDVSLSEGTGPFGPLFRRTHLAVSPPPSLSLEVLQKLKSWAIKVLEDLAARGEGSLDFFVDGERAFLAEGDGGAHLGLEPWVERSGTEVVGWVHPMDPHTGLPQPGMLRILQYPEGALIFPGCAEGAWVGGGPLLALKGAGDGLPLALLGLLVELDAVRVQGGLQASIPYLREVCASPWVQEGLFYFRYLEDEFVPDVQPLAEDRSSALLEHLLQVEPALLGEQVVIDGQVRVVRTSGRGESALGQVEKLGHGAWMVSQGDITRLVRVFEGGGGRTLRALCAGRALDVQQGVPAWNGGSVVALDSGSSWVPHGVASLLASALQWQVSPGQCVHRGQVLARLS